MQMVLSFLLQKRMYQLSTNSFSPCDRMIMIIVSFCLPALPLAINITYISPQLNGWLAGLPSVHGWYGGKYLVNCWRRFRFKHVYNVHIPPSNMGCQDSVYRGSGSSGEMTLRAMPARYRYKVNKNLDEPHEPNFTESQIFKKSFSQVTCDE